MAVDKLVDSTQLDADLTSVANAIRTKGGTSSQLAFPAGFVQAIGDIETGGGGYTLEEIVEGTLSGPIVYTGTKLRSCQFMQSHITSFVGANVTGFANDAVSSERATFKNCTTLQSVELPLFNVTNNCQNMFYGCTGLTSAKLFKWGTVAIGSFRGCTSLPAIAFPSATRVEADALRSCTALTAVDFGKTVNFAGGDVTRGDSNLTTIILRGTTRSTITAANVFANGTPFASGGVGGTIYIPESLYDHLGDGTALDYKAATNWSTIDGYGTITWAQIEGSIYETQYADGTPIT